MGKRQHQKDKMYLTYTEWTTLYGGKRSGTATEEDSSFKRLPYDHCCLCLQPFEDPYCDEDGNVFELQAVIEFVKKFKINPVTGKKMDLKSLTKLKFHKNSEENYHCPVLFKPFTKNSYIVAIKPTGNVYCYEAIEQLNIKGKNWKDLVDDTPFTRNDIITIQDPNHLGKFNISTFHHVKNNLRVETEEEIALRKDPHARLKTVSAETRDILNELEREYKAPEVKEVKKEVADVVNAAHFSTGMVAASFTSTAMVPETVHEAAIVSEDDLRHERVKKKGYVRLVTNLGPLNLELYCDVTPKTCDNFIRLANSGYYNGTKFHRSIRHFMIQGGDPTATGLGGESIWKKPFEDEIRPNLHHTGRGILSMANSGPNTNGSQFFITFRSCRQLDGKHTIFGKLVGGIDTLNAMEQIEVDNKDRPIQDIVIEVAQVFVDPFTEVEEQDIVIEIAQVIVDPFTEVEEQASNTLINNHSGKQVGGLDKLNTMEQIEVDNKDRPIQDIVIEVAQVFVDPFTEVEEQLALERAAELKRQAESGPGVKPKKATQQQPLKVFRQGVGKYLNLQEAGPSKPGLKTDDVPAKKPKKDKNYKFGAFENW